MKKYFYSVLIMAIFAIGFAASDDSESSEKGKQEQTRKTEMEIIEDQGFDDGVDFARKDRGEFINDFIRNGNTRNAGEQQLKVAAGAVYSVEHPNTSDELIERYSEKYLEGYLSILK